MYNLCMKKFIQFGLILLGAILLFYPLFLSKTFGDVSFAQVVFHLTTPLKQADIRLVYKGVLYVIIIPVFITGAIFYFEKKLKNSYLWCFGILMIAGGIGHGLYILKIPQYYNDIHNPTNLYKNHYINPNDLDVHFKNHKNVVLIYLESVENSYQDTSLFPINALPLLTKKQTQNTYFSGFKQMSGTNWTIAGITASLCGVPLKIPIKGVRMDMFADFLPSLVCIPQLLQKNGYDTAFLLGSSAEFSGIDNFATQHGFKTFWGIDELDKEQKIVPNMKGTGWGLNDRTLFDFAQKKIQQIAKKNTPFLFVISTIDTHHPNGYFDSSVCTAKQKNFLDVVSCADTVVNQFVDWLQAQPYAKDTVIILLGDHLAMDNDIYDIIQRKKNREVFNLFINSSTKGHISKPLTSFDWAPTILAAAGGSWSQNGFGLGRNLFSNTPTLLEILGDELEKNIRRHASEYESFFKKNK